MVACRPRCRYGAPKGVNPDAPGRKWRPGSRYFPYYTDPWVAEIGFDPRRRRHLTHQQARAIDSAIDQYNQVIVEVVRAARGEGRDWRVLDLTDVLDGLSARRYTDASSAARNNWSPRALPGPIADLDTRFFLSDAAGRTQGGLFGLDGVHPTTSGNGVLAQAVLDVLAVPGATPIDFALLRARDTLNSRPPALLAQLFDLLSRCCPCSSPAGAAPAHDAMRRSATQPSRIRQALIRALRSAAPGWVAAAAAVRCST